MKKHRIILAVLATSLLLGQPMVAQEQSQPNRISRLKKEIQEFRDALKCVRQKGFRKCTPAQKKRIIAAGTALVAIVLVAGGVWWWHSEQAIGAVSQRWPKPSLVTVQAERQTRKLEEQERDRNPRNATRGDLGKREAEDVDRPDTLTILQNARDAERKMLQGLLSWEVDKGDLSKIKEYMVEGADPDREDWKGRLLLDVAKTREIKALLQGEADFRRVLSAQSLEEPVEGIELPAEVREGILKYAFAREVERRAEMTRAVERATAFEEFPFHEGSGEAEE